MNSDRFVTKRGHEVKSTLPMLICLTLFFSGFLAFNIVFFNVINLKLKTINKETNPLKLNDSKYESHLPNVPIFSG